jgi:hypothetical protein
MGDKGNQSRASGILGSIVGIGELLKEKVSHKEAGKK